MRQSTRRIRTLLATPLAALLLSLSVAVPVLEVAEVSHEPVAESAHEPGACPAPHDHTVCAQVGANHSAPGRSAPEIARGIVARVSAVGSSAEVSALDGGLISPARAPPAI
jgi:hypothetical protein